MPHASSHEMCSSGEKITAEELANYGVVSSVVNSKEELEKETSKYVDMILSGAPNAIAESKALAYYVASHSHEDSVKQAISTFERAIKGPEAAYGVQCFVQKQKPDWNSLHSKL
jgi:enoyl-CoA hydratase/carnithine racemase